MLKALVDGIARVWQSRWLTGAVLLPLSAAMAFGIWRGRHELFDVDAQVRVELNYMHTRTRDISITGRAPLWSARDERMKCMLIGPCDVHVRCTDLPQAMLSLEVSWNNALYGDTLRIEDAATGQEYLVDDPVANRTNILVPLTRMETTLRLRPSQPALAIRVEKLVLHTDGALRPFRLDRHWELVSEDEFCGVYLGSGFWPRLPGSTHLYTKRHAYIMFKAHQEGPYIVRLGFSRSDPDALMPIVAVDNHRIWSVYDGTTVWNRAITVDGATTLELKVDLGKGNLFTIECPGRMDSGYERGKNLDLRRFAYDIALERCRIIPDK